MSLSSEQWFVEYFDNLMMKFVSHKTYDKHADRDFTLFEFKGKLHESTFCEDGLQFQTVWWRS